MVLTIGKKLTIAFAILILILGTVISLNQMVNTQAKNDFQKINNETLPALLLLEKILIYQQRT